VELESRQKLGYPPCGELVRLLVSGPDEQVVAGTAHRIGRQVEAHWASENITGHQLLGPSPAPLARLRSMYRWHLLLKGPDGQVLRRTARRLMSMPGLPDGVNLAVDTYPLNLL